MFKNELVKIDTLVHKSNETLQNVSQQLQKQIAKHLMESYEELITNYEGNIDSIVNVLEKAWKTLSNEEKIRREELFPVLNLHKLQEILGHLISGPYEELLVITPQIPELIPLEKLESLSKEMTLKIASTELHTNSLVKKLLQNEHIEYKRRQKDDFIGILADNTFLVMAYYEKDSKYPLRNIIGYATDHPPFIKLFENELRNKWTFARYEDRKEIEYNLNLIVENLNDYSGWKIGEILHEIIEIVQGMKGLSLNILEIKLLRNQLRKMNYCLDDDLKQEIVSKIKKFNKEVAQVDLEEPEIRLPKDAKPEVEIKEPIPAPREEDFLEEEFLQSEIELSQKMRRQPLEKKKLSPIKNKIPVQKESEDKHIDTASEIDKRSGKFEVLFKGIDSLAGSEISVLLHEIIDEIIEREGFSMSLRGVKNWVTKLKRVQDPLGDQVKTEFMQDFSKLLEKYAPKLLKKEAEEGVPSFVALEEGSSEQKTPENSLGDKFNALIKNIEEKEGPALSSILQEISDDLLESHGAIAVRELRNWISKLRSIRSPLNAQMKAEFRNKIEIWRERFA
ncbi:MAG: hypothetical protein EU544_05240 [Promethearchaeota archaeon]|nr:MAG: hypothetical protein EU544_05240 [Candidatus Lokiarchaeota archaeon]